MSGSTIYQEGKTFQVAGNGFAPQNDVLERTWGGRQDWPRGWFSGAQEQASPHPRSSAQSSVELEKVENTASPARPPAEASAPCAAFLNVCPGCTSKGVLATRTALSFGLFTSRGQRKCLSPRFWGHRSCQEGGSVCSCLQDQAFWVNICVLWLIA